LTSTANLPFQPVGCPSWQSKVELDKPFSFVLSHVFEVYVTDHTVRRESVTRAKLAYDVAKSVKRFLEVRCCSTKISILASEAITQREKEKGHGDHSECSWKDVPLGETYLTRLVRVSNASWQPEIFVGQPYTVKTPASLPSA